MMNMNDCLKAVMLLGEYVDSMNIDWFAFPEQTSNHVNIVMVPAKDFVVTIEGMVNNGYLPSCLTMRKGETFFRLRRMYSATKMLIDFKRLYKHRIATDLHTVKEIPYHKGMQARGWEVIVSQYVNGCHTGDNIREVDVIASIGRIEAKIGNGKLLSQAENDDS